MSRALVLGGGGVTGIAWEVGVLVGLRRAGVDPGTADLVVGTSAGSTVGALLATGADLEALAARQGAGVVDEAPIAADMDRVMAAFAILYDRAIPPREARARVGALALAATVGDEAAYLTRFAGALAGRAWPRTPRLCITGVDVASGEPAAWDAASDVPLVSAVAASCAVPCVFPPVTIQGRRYMDGGVRSHLNADLAKGASNLLLIAPMEGLLPRWPRERASLGEVAAVLVQPDPAALEAIGPNVMDSSRRREALLAGEAQGAAAAAEVRKIWG